MKTILQITGELLIYLKFADVTSGIIAITLQFY